MTKALGLSSSMADDSDPKPKREIRIPIPDLDGVKAKVSKAADLLVVGAGTFVKKNPLIATILTIIVFVAIKTLLVSAYHGR